MRRICATKIVATLGPATSDPKTIEAIFKAGADVFRLNFSHGAHESHRKSYDLLRALEKKTGRPIAILADLQGPKLRVGMGGTQVFGAVMELITWLKNNRRVAPPDCL